LLIEVVVKATIHPPRSIVHQALPALIGPSSPLTNESLDFVSRG